MASLSNHRGPQYRCAIDTQEMPDLFPIFRAETGAFGATDDDQQGQTGLPAHAQKEDRRRSQIPHVPVKKRARGDSCPQYRVFRDVIAVFFSSFRTTGPLCFRGMYSCGSVAFSVEPTALSPCAGMGLQSHEQQGSQLHGYCARFTASFSSASDATTGPFFLRVDWVGVRRPDKSGGWPQQKVECKEKVPSRLAHAQQDNRPLKNRHCDQKKKDFFLFQTKKRKKERGIPVRAVRGCGSSRTRTAQEWA